MWPSTSTDSFELAYSANQIIMSKWIGLTKIKVTGYFDRKIITPIGQTLKQSEPTAPRGEKKYKRNLWDNNQLRNR